VTVKTTAGLAGLARPKLSGTTQVFAARLFGAHVTKTNALESPVIASFVRGLPVRDVEATLADALGGQAPPPHPAFQFHRAHLRRDRRRVKVTAGCPARPSASPSSGLSSTAPQPTDAA
jgi:hypothetical protein